MMKEESGTQCQFAIDDIYWDGGGLAISSVAFNAGTYYSDDSNAYITVTDEAAAGTQVTATVDNGTDTISLDVTLDDNGTGTAVVNFGATDDETDTIAIAVGNTLTVSYTDTYGTLRTDSAIITASGPTVGTFGVFTDTTPVTTMLTIGEDSEIYVWENTLTQGSIEPFEGYNVITWQTTGTGWFGGGVMVNDGIDLTDFAGGSVKFMMKMPAEVTFKIGVQDTNGHEHYVTFPASTNVFGLTRNGDWGQAIIPVNELADGVDLSAMSYVFTILEENGTACEFAIDDIYWEEGSGNQEGDSDIAFDAQSYMEDATSATIAVLDEDAAGSTVAITVDNGSESISIDVVLDSNGDGTATVNFGATNDDTNTLAIAAGNTITASFTDSHSDLLTDTATIQSSGPGVDRFGIFTDTTPVTDGITVGSNANIYVWENTLTAGSIEPYEGDNGISWQSNGMGWFGAGIQSTQALDLSAYAGGTVEIMIKMPANVTFKIGMTDQAGHEKYVSFPANQTVFGLTRDGEWGRASIPLSEYISTINFQSMDYVFTILEENGTQCEFGLDDIYWQKATSRNAGK